MASHSARALATNAVHLSERWRCQSGERARTFRYVGWNPFTVGKTTHQQIPNIARIFAAARRAHRRPPVAEADVRAAIEFVGGVVEPGDLTSHRVDQRFGTTQLHWARAATATPLPILDRNATDERRAQCTPDNHEQAPDTDKTNFS
jgi:hypothetical protein